jgi:hypothetical protein
MLAVRPDSRALDQVEKGCAFGGAGTAPDHDDDSMMRLDPREPEEVIPVAGDENAASVIGKIEERIVGKIFWKGLPKKRHFVAQLDK